MFLNAAGLEKVQARFDKLPLRLSPFFKAFLKLLDEHAGADGWIEKTPDHIYCLDMIEKYVPGVLIIHVVRDGEAAVASIADAVQRYEDWKKRFPDDPQERIRRMLALRNRAVAQSKRYAGRSGHFIVRHEDLTKNPQEEVRKITRFLGIPYSDDLLNFDAEPYIAPHEEHKKNMGHEIRPQESKFQKVFNEDEQAYIRRHLIKAL